MSKKTVQEIAGKIIKCPKCGTRCRYDLTNEYRPFCSVTCQNHDIINWAEGTYRVAGPTVEENAPEGQGSEEE